MVLNIYRMKPEERLYVSSQSMQIEGQTGCIGHLRGNFGDGQEFYTTWDDHRKQYKTEEFKSELDEVVNALRAEGGCGLLKNRFSMERFCSEHQEAAVIDMDFYPRYGFRLDTAQHTYMLCCDPTPGNNNLYMYAYVSRLLNHHMEKTKSGIRFIDPNYKEVFRIPDGDKIQITLPDSEKLLRTCRFIDETHLEVGSNPYHICEFAERMEQAGNTVIPMRSSLPEKCYSIMPSTGEIIILRHGENGYSPTDFHFNNKENMRRVVDNVNGKLGVTKAQEAAMLAGSLFGWHTPAADPKNYNEKGSPIKPAKKESRGYER